MSNHCIPLTSQDDKAIYHESVQPPEEPVSIPCHPTPEIPLAMKNMDILSNQCSTLSSLDNKCSCPTRAQPPDEPSSLPYPPTPENREKLKSWIVNTMHPAPSTPVPSNHC